MKTKDYRWASDEERDVSMEVLTGLDAGRQLSIVPISYRGMEIYRWKDLEAGDEEAWVARRVVQKLYELGLVTGWGTDRKYWGITQGGREFVRNPR